MGRPSRGVGDLGRGRARARGRRTVLPAGGSSRLWARRPRLRGAEPGTDPRRAWPGGGGLGTCTHSLGSAAAAAPRAALLSRRTAILSARGPRPRHVRLRFVPPLSPRPHAAASRLELVSTPRPVPASRAPLLLRTCPLRLSELPGCNARQSRESEWVDFWVTESNPSPCFWVFRAGFERPCIFPARRCQIFQGFLYCFCLNTIPNKDCDSHRVRASVNS